MPTGEESGTTVTEGKATVESKDNISIRIPTSSPDTGSTTGTGIPLYP